MSAQLQVMVFCIHSGLGSRLTKLIITLLWCIPLVAGSYILQVKVVLARTSIIEISIGKPEENLMRALIIFALGIIFGSGAACADSSSTNLKGHDRSPTS